MSDGGKDHLCARGSFRKFYCRLYILQGFSIGSGGEIYSFHVRIDDNISIRKKYR